MKLGFIGTGHLAGFFVEGLARTGSGYQIFVSPRNEAKAAELSRRFGARISDNVEIAKSCDLVVVSLLPPAAPAVLKGLQFRTGQTVLSVMAGIGLDAMRDMVSPATAAISMMTGLANAHNVGPSALYPDNAAARAMLERLGPVHVYGDENTYAAASVLGAFSGMSMLMMRDVIDWFIANGLVPADARRLVAEVLKGNAAMLLEPEVHMNQVAGVVTPGGITEQGWRIVEAGGTWPAALDAILQRVSTRN